jgi:hypothetical protein
MLLKSLTVKEIMLKGVIKTPFLYFYLHIKKNILIFALNLKIILLWVTN